MNDEDAKLVVLARGAMARADASTARRCVMSTAARTPPHPLICRR